ncbi:MAG: hypothetical protein K2U26_20735 [Cyclobacteriaceae bacterium]|nr:hypothetical protein [Cyclobacteriaceae bacterium]
MMQVRLFSRLSALVFVLLLATQAQGQQNLFNVPSSDITPKAKPFFQQQLNLSSGLVQFNSTFSYGLGRGAEIGVNILGLNVNT